MAIYHATADPKLKIEGKQYSMFIGRWQPWHPGHRWRPWAVLSGAMQFSFTEKNVNMS
jgi:hypothetical protein